MKLLLDSTGAAVLRNGMPVYAREDGREIEFDGAQAFAKIGQLTGENTAARKRAEEAEAKLQAQSKLYEGIEDPDLARKALETTKNLDDGKLILANKVDEIKTAAAKAAEDRVLAATKAHAEKLALTQAELDKRTQELNTHIIGGGFSRTKLITDEKHPMRLNIPADVAEAFFGRNFKVEDGRAVGYDSSGGKIYSTVRPGEVADFDEALETLVDRYPNKASILRGSGASGGCASQNPGGSGRADLMKLPPRERMNAARAQRK